MSPFESVAGSVDHWRGPLSIAWLAVLLVWESVAPFAPLFKGPVPRFRHLALNLGLSLLNSIVVALVFSSAWKAVASWAADHQFGLLNWFPISSGVHFILALALLDFWTYAWHRLNHQVSWFWRFHQVHHVDDCMDVTTANRFHLGEITLSSVFRIAIIALAGIRFGELVIYETCLQFWVQWQHTNIGLPNALDRLLSWLVVTPAMHKVHHSPDPAETNSNYASLFAFWDRLCGTFVAFNPGVDVRFGLDSNTAARARTAAGLLLLPFRPVPPINPALNPPRSPLI